MSPTGGGGTTLHRANQCGNAIVGVINSVRESVQAGRRIKIAVYQANDVRILNKLRDAAAAGVEVTIVADNRPDSSGRETHALGTLKERVDQFNREGGVGYRPIQLKVITGMGDYGIMHLKMLYAEYGDIRHLIFGSYNFTGNAAKMSYENCARLSHFPSAADAVADNIIVPVVAGDGDIQSIRDAITSMRVKINFLAARARFPTEAGMDFGQPRAVAVVAEPAAAPVPAAVEPVQPARVQVAAQASVGAEEHAGIGLGHLPAAGSMSSSAAAPAPAEDERIYHPSPPRCSERLRRGVGVADENPPAGSANHSPEKPSRPRPAGY